MTYPRRTLVRPEPLRVGERVVDLHLFQKTGRKIIGVVSSLCEIEANGVTLACAVVRGGDPGRAWVVCDELQRWRRALASELPS